MFEAILNFSSNGNDECLVNSNIAASWLKLSCNLLHQLIKIPFPCFQLIFHSTQQKLQSFKSSSKVEITDLSPSSLKCYKCDAIRRGQTSPISAQFNVESPTSSEILIRCQFLFGNKTLWPDFARAGAYPMKNSRNHLQRLLL